MGYECILSWYSSCPLIIQRMSSMRYKVLVIEDDKVDQMAFKRFVMDENPPYDYVIAGSV